MYKLEITCLKADFEKKESKFNDFKDSFRQGIIKSHTTVKELSENLNDLLVILNQNSEISSDKTVKKNKKGTKTYTFRYLIIENGPKNLQI